MALIQAYLRRLDEEDRQRAFEQFLDGLWEEKVIEIADKLMKVAGKRLTLTSEKDAANKAIYDLEEAMSAAAAVLIEHQED